MKLLTALCLILATIYQTNADNALQDKLNYLKDLTLRIKKDAQAIESSLGTSVADFDHAVKNGFHEGQKGVSGVYDRAMKHLESVPEECVRGVKDNLLQLQSAADRTFLSCSNLTVAVTDLGNLVTYSGNMLLGLARSLQELTWFTNCFSWNPLKSIPCFFEWIGLIFQGTKGLIHSLGNFNTELDSTLLNILKIIEYCQARTTDEHDVLTVMGPVHQCAQQRVPHQLYSIQN